MKRISKTGLFVWLLLLVAEGCTRTEVEEKDLPPHMMKEVEAVFNLNVLAGRIPQTRSITFTPEGTFETDSVATAMTDSVVTRSATAMSEGEEDLISHLWVGQYDASGNRLFSQYIASLTGTTVNLKLKASGEATHHVWFVANCGDLGEIATEATLKEHVFAYLSTADGLPQNRLCGMTGMWSGIIRDNGVESIGVDMIRTVAKISFEYLIEGNGFTFTPSSVKLKSVPDKIRIEETISQLADVTYKEYTGIANANRAAMYWYLPENPAGEATGENAVTSEKEKTGKGVTNATCIELTGTAVQSGVTYENVTFRFYPGSKEHNNYNDYNIKRNHYYTMSVTLKGIDITDQRITVGTIPPIDTGGLQTMPAKKGGTTQLQITARPGDKWSFKLPDWLSAVINDTISMGYGASVGYQGPAKIVFKAETTNPTAQQRSFPFIMNVTGEEQNIEIIQDGSEINVDGSISLGAALGSEGQSSFTATEGLNWRAVLTDVNWLEWATGVEYTGNEATGKAQTLTVKATTSNPYARTRTNSITVKGGQSVGDLTYNDLKKEIPVSQAASTVTCPTQPVEVSAEGATSASSSFTATPNLSWKVSVSDAIDWIRLTDVLAGQTTVNPQSIVFNVPVNPNSTVRTGAITVRVGDETEGPTGEISVQQAASSLTVDEIPTPLAPTADASGSIGFTATRGLSYSITHPDWLTFAGETSGTTSGGQQTIAYTTNSINKYKEARSGNIAVTAGNMAKERAVTQEASTFKVEPRTIELPNTASSAEATITGTSGLSWILTSTGDAAITPTITKGDLTGTSQIITFSAPANEGGQRSADFIIAVTDGNHSDTVTVNQAATLSAFDVEINQNVLISYYARLINGYTWSTHPPFDREGTNMASSHGITNVNLSSSPTMTGSYIIQVQRTHSPNTYYSYADSKAYCDGLEEDSCSDWRLPTMIELNAVYDQKKVIEAGPGAVAFQGGDYWTTSYHNGSDKRCTVYFSDGHFYYNNLGGMCRVRCVRNK